MVSHMGETAKRTRPMSAAVTCSRITIQD
jgi:hypothetical protein